MAVYTVHAPDESDLRDGGDIGEYTERFAFVPERFSLLAMLFALPWLLVHRLWLAAAGFLGLVVILNGVGTVLGLSEQTLGFFSLALSVLVGFEAHNLRRLALERANYKMVGVVSASGQVEAEHKFFREWLQMRAGQHQQPSMREATAVT